MKAGYNIPKEMSASTIKMLAPWCREAMNFLATFSCFLATFSCLIVFEITRQKFVLGHEQRRFVAHIRQTEIERRKNEGLPTIDVANIMVVDANGIPI